MATILHKYHQPAFTDEELSAERIGGIYERHKDRTYNFKVFIYLKYREVERERRETGKEDVGLREGEKANSKRL